MMKKLLVLLFVLVISCKTVSVNNKLQRSTKSSIELGVIGTVEKGILNSTFATHSLPVYKHKLRVGVQKTSFNKATFKAVTDAAKQQNKVVSVNYVDSLDTKPTYISLQILDKVLLLKELNASYNSEVSNYLKNSNNNNIVTELSTLFSNTVMNSIEQADEVYLVNNKSQKYYLELVKSGKVFKTVDIIKAIPFAYKTKTFCFKKEYGKITIANLVSANEGCANDSYRNVKRLHKKENLFKY